MAEHLRQMDLVEVADGQHIELPDSRRGQRPLFARNADELRAAHLLSSRYHTTSLTTAVSPHLEVSRTPLKDLTRTSLGELLLEVTFRGGYLTLRTMEPAYVDGGIITVVEDHEGTAAKICIYNYTANLNLNLQEFFPVGTVFILKEPFCSETKDGDCILRCEHISDMIIIYDGHELSNFAPGIVWRNDVIDPLLRHNRHPPPVTACEWKERGHALLVDGKRQLAIRCLFMSLKKIDLEIDPDTCVNILNAKFGLGFMGLGKFEAALKYAQELLESEPENATGLVVAGKACYPLRRYREAMTYFEEFIRVNKESVRSVIDLLIKCKARRTECEDGEYDIGEMFSSGRNFPRQFIDCADYLGPIRVEIIRGIGRRVVTTCHVQPGTLLVVSKALAFSWQPVEKLNWMSRGECVCWQDLMVHLAQKIATNPKTFGPIIYSLYDGSDPITEVLPTWFCDPETEMEPIVDMKKLRGIVTHNVFGNGPSEVRAGLGIFQWPSYFNHNCLPNVSYHKFNDIIFIRAIQAIQEGEEVFLPCVSSDIRLSSRMKLCSHRGVVCGCLLCRLEEEEVSEVTCAQEKQILLSNAYEMMYETISEDKVVDLPKFIKDLRQMIIEVEEAYEDAESYPRKSTVSAIYELLAKAYAKDQPASDHSAQPDEEIECHKMILRLHGFDPKALVRYLETGEDLIPPDAILNENVLAAVCRLVGLYFHTKQLKNKGRWVKILLALEKIYSGGNVKVAKQKYPSIKSLIPHCKTLLSV